MLLLLIAPLFVEASGVHKKGEFLIERLLFLNERVSFKLNKFLWKGRAFNIWKGEFVIGKVSFCLRMANL